MRRTCATGRIEPRAACGLSASPIPASVANGTLAGQDSMPRGGTCGGVSAKAQRIRQRTTSVTGGERESATPVAAHGSLAGPQRGNAKLRL